MNGGPVEPRTACCPREDAQNSSFSEAIFHENTHNSEKERQSTTKTHTIQRRNEKKKRAHTIQRRNDTQNHQTHSRTTQLAASEPTQPAAFRRKAPSRSAARARAPHRTSTDTPARYWWQSSSRGCACLRHSDVCLHWLFPMACFSAIILCCFVLLCSAGFSMVFE